MKDSSDTHPNHLPDSSYGLFIDNQWVSDEYGETLDIINPANGKILTNIPNATAADVDRAVQAAQRAFVTWRTTSPAERANA
ncbi:aldehyde dehydrogenase family protein, partial [Pseudomonas aeruginosa]